MLIDEVQHLPDWSSRLKAEWDRLRRLRIPMQVVASGSSALRLAKGSKETLAGRFERLELAHWSASSLARAFGVPPSAAADMIVRESGYPGAVELRGDRRRWSAYVRDAIVEPAIGRDLLALRAVRKPALLRQVFTVAASSPARIVSLQKLQGQIQDPGAPETLSHYPGGRLLGRAAPEVLRPLAETAGGAAQARAAQQRALRRHGSARFLRPERRAGALRRLGRKRLPGVRVERRTAAHLLARGAARGGRGDQAGVPYAYGAAVDVLGDEVVYTSSDRPELRVVDASGRLVRIIRMTDRTPSTLSAADRERYVSWVEGVSRASGRSDPVQVVREYHARFAALPPGRTLPLVDRLRVDAAGRIWTRDWVGSWHEGEQAWSVHAADGTPLARVRTPAEVTVTHIGPGHLTGVWRDELGVEHVVVHRIVEGGEG